MNDGLVAIFGLPGGMEWIVILILGLLLFGRRLPDVARSVGKSIVEFKKGLKDVGKEIDEESTSCEKLPPTSNSSSLSASEHHEVQGGESRDAPEDHTKHIA